MVSTWFARNDPKNVGPCGRWTIRRRVSTRTEESQESLRWWSWNIKITKRISNMGVEQNLYDIDRNCICWGPMNIHKSCSVWTLGTWFMAIKKGTRMMRPWILAKNICQTTTQKTQDLWTKPRVGTRFHEITKTSWLVVTGTMEFYDFPIRLGSSSSQLTFTNHHFSEG